MSGKTQSNYADGLSAFCQYLVERGLLKENPIAGLADFNTTPMTQRRAMTAGELTKFFDALENDPDRHVQRRRLGYEVALASGLRKNELRSLVVADLNVKKCGLKLHPEWTKNCKEGFQPLPRSLVEKLAESAQGKADTDPLVYVCVNAALMLDQDLERANIPKMAPGGKLDFHALRVAYVTLLLESGIDAKTAQTLARHSNLALTMETYGRARQDKLAAAAEVIGRAILPKECVTSVLLKVVGAEDNAVTAYQNNALHEIKITEREGFEPPSVLQR